MPTLLNNITDNPGAKQKKFIKGRGIGSTKGKTAGAGVKGQKARTGVSIKGFEGGQMPLHRRLPKRGFHNPFPNKLVAVNTGQLQKYIDSGKLDAKGTVNAEALVKAGIIKNTNFPVKLLAKGEIKAKLTIEVGAASESAVKAVEKAGGKVTVLKRKVSEKSLAQAEKSKAKKEKKAAAKKGGKKAAAAEAAE